ncbi:hypothetical protein [Micromonospora lupini]|nr:hypothetical protein [Micromonospora lupini]
MMEEAIRSPLKGSACENAAYGGLLDVDRTRKLVEQQRPELSQ